MPIGTDWQCKITLYEPTIAAMQSHQLWWFFIVTKYHSFTFVHTFSFVHGLYGTTWLSDAVASATWHLHSWDCCLCRLFKINKITPNLQLAVAHSHWFHPKIGLPILVFHIPCSVAMHAHQLSLTGNGSSCFTYCYHTRNKRINKRQNFPARTMKTRNQTYDHWTQMGLALGRVRK